MFEQFHRAAEPWFELVKTWEKEIREAHLPVLLLVLYDFGRQLDKPDRAAARDSRASVAAEDLRCPVLSGTCAICAAGLKPAHVSSCWQPDAAQYALDLYVLSDGIPGLIEQMLAHWEKLGQAELYSDGRWVISPDLPYTVPGRLREELIDEPLNQCAVKAKEIDPSLDAGTLPGMAAHWGLGGGQLY